jgi:hypothetical protein
MSAIPNFPTTSFAPDYDNSRLFAVRICKHIIANLIMKCISWAGWANSTIFLSFFLSDIYQDNAHNVKTYQYIYNLTFLFVFLIILFLYRSFYFLQYSLISVSTDPSPLGTKYARGNNAPVQFEIEIVLIS